METYDLSTAAAEMLAALALSDGEVHPAEVAAIRGACQEWGLPFEKVERALERAECEPRRRFLDCAAAVPPADRELVAALLCEVAAADRRLDDTEAELLKTLGEAWGVPIRFVNRSFEWDSAQREVIEAPANGCLLISAGPGMGKTAVACARVSHLVSEHGVTDTNIWLISFTRAAVGELKARISEFADTPEKAVDVKICTIDSQAWRVRYGFTETQVKKLFGDFETGIDQAIELIGRKRGEFEEAFADLEHLIVDEAQDITGARARFLLEIVKLLSPGCGVTVFHDPAQAIYDYALKQTDQIRFVDEFKKLLGERLQERALDKIHRTNDPVLLRLYEDLRVDILGNSDASGADFEARADLVKQAVGGSEEFDVRKLGSYSNALVLFRRRVEVIQASAFMCRDGIAHRLRMSDLPATVHPWIGLTLHTVHDREIDQETFRRLAAAAYQKCDGALFDDDELEPFLKEKWALLHRLGRAGPRSPMVDLWKIRALIAGGCPDEFRALELGMSGPILGTIHASKGREAKHVILQIGRSWGGRNDDVDHAEESRVLFVGATRAQERLSVQDGLSLPFASAINQRRVYRSSRKYANGAQVQIGLDGDQDFRSFAETPRDLFELVARGVPWTCTATTQPGPPWQYELTDEKGLQLGRLKQGVNFDLFKLANIRFKRDGGRPPRELRGLSVLGFTTVVEAPGAQGPKLAAPFDRSGFWVAPIVVGFPMAFCQWPKNKQWN